MEHDFDKFPELTNQQINDIGFTSPHPQITEDFRAVVTKVHDGDTITLECDFRDFAFPLRFLDIDAQELSEGGAEVRDWLKEQILGEEVEIKINKNNRVGKYGRLLGYVIHKGLNLNEMMLASGMVQKFGKKGEGEIPQLSKMFAEVAI